MSSNFGFDRPVFPAWKVFGAGVLVITALSAVFLTGTWPSVLWTSGVGIASGGAILVGIRSNHLRPRGAWLFLSLGITANATGLIVEHIVTNVFKGNATPSIADAFYLTIFPAVALGLAVLIRQRSGRHNQGVLVDSAIIWTALTLLTWVLIIEPVARSTQSGWLGPALSLAYPIGDVVLMAAMVRLLVGGGTRITSLRMLVGALTLFLAADTVWSAVNQLNLNPGQVQLHLLSMTSLLAWGLFGVAALHPSAIRIVTPIEDDNRQNNRSMTAALVVTALVAPVTLSIEGAIGQVEDAYAIAAGSALLFCLVVLRMNQLLRKVKLQAFRLEEMALEDPLTGLPNRRRLTQELTDAIRRSRRDGQPLALAMIDLDHFKLFNDEYGHPAGDQLLRGAAASWSSAMRSVDMLVRFGGEEFVVVLPQSDAVRAEEVVERIRSATPLAQTFSAGIAMLTDDDVPETLMERADRALYQAKAAGRNCTVIGASTTGEPALS